MRIERIDVQVLVWPVHDPPHWMSFTPALTCSELLVRIHTDAGITGLGHVDSGKVFTPDSQGRPRPAGAALVAKNEFVPMLVGSRFAVENVSRLARGEEPTSVVPPT